MALRSQSGNAILILIFGLFALGLAGGVYFAFSSGQGTDLDRSLKEARAAYDDAVQRMDQALNNPATVDASLGRNAGFQCLFSNDGACRGQGGAFLLFESAQAQRPLSHLAVNTGSDPGGVPCQGFPSKECPLRVETVWEPVCAGDRCENTRSLRVKAKITLAAIEGKEAPLQWTRDALFTPNFQLSQGAVCSRGGGEWTGAECLTPSQAAERRLASPTARPPEAPPAPDPQDNRAASEVPAPVQQVVYECPNQIVVQGQYYPVQFLSADRGQVTVPAMSCHAPGAYDVFVFQCAAKNPAAFPNEGQWIQVEAAMAPACDQNGNAVTNLPVRF